MATSSVKFRPPRKLADRETAESLTQWKNEFIVYAQRDQTFAQFLTCNWSQTELNMGFENGPTGSAEEQAENCKLFINHIMTFLKNPFWNHEIRDRSTSLASIWKTFDDIFEVESTADSFLDIASLQYNGSESYLTFLARIKFHLENHLPPGGTTVDGITTPPGGDLMSVAMLDIATYIWLDRVDKRLIERVKIEFGVQIKEGARISKLAPQIAKSIPGMLKKMGNTRNEVVRALNDIKSEANAIEDTPIYAMSYGRGGGQSNRGAPRGRGAGRGNYNANRGGGRGAQRRQKGSAICRHCHWLATHWDVKEIDYHHDTKSCRRTMPAEVTFNYVDDFEEEEEYTEPLDECEEIPEG